MSGRFVVSHYIDSQERAFLINYLATEISTDETNFIDLAGDQVSVGLEKTLKKNLTDANSASVQYEVYNSLAAPGCKNTGGATGLNTLWTAGRSTTAYADGTGEYEQATLGCFPTYLQGVASRVTAPTWTAAIAELGLEGVANPTVTYFGTSALWQTRPVGFSEGASLQTYASTYYYDRNQSQAWRFTHSGGTRTLTMTPTSGQDFYLELIGPGGWVAGSTGSDRTGLARTLTVSNLPAGVYAARVRAGRTTATGLNSYSITVN